MRFSLALSFALFAILGANAQPVSESPEMVARGISESPEMLARDVDFFKRAHRCASDADCPPGWICAINNGETRGQCMRQQLPTPPADGHHH
jgi:hypothetical protein